MKKSLLALVFAAALAVPAMAENMWVAGSFSYGSDNQEWNGRSRSATSWSIEPEFGYSLNEKWDIGLDLAYSSQVNTDTVYGFNPGIGPAFDVKTMDIAPFARYHIAQIAGVDVMLKGSLFYLKSDVEFRGVDHTFAVNGYGISVAPIISYSINETWSIGAELNFAELSFMHAETDDDWEDIKTEQFGFNLNDGSLISVGIVYHF